MTLEERAAHVTQMFRVICNCYLLQRGCLPPLIYTLTERDNVRFHRGAIIPWRKLCERRATLRASPRLVVLLYRVIDLIPRELPDRRCILSFARRVQQRPSFVKRRFMPVFQTRVSLSRNRDDVVQIVTRENHLVCDLVTERICTR